MSEDWIDLSLPLRDGGPSFPGGSPCTIVPVRTMPPDVLNLRSVMIGSHQGTHLDAPLHFLEDGLSVDRVPFEQVVG